MRDDVVDQIVNALTGACQKCNGRGHIRAPSYSWTGELVNFGGSFDGYPVSMCIACDGTGEAR